MYVADKWYYHSDKIVAWHLRNYFPWKIYVSGINIMHESLKCTIVWFKKKDSALIVIVYEIIIVFL